MANSFTTPGVPAAGATPADNSVTSAKIADGTIVNADINASAAIAYTKLNLASSIVTGDIVDGTIAGGDLSSSIAIPSAATATTQSANDNSTKISTTAYTETAVANSGTNLNAHDFGFISWNQPVWLNNAGSAMTKGFILMYGVPIRTTATITNIVFYVTSAGNTLSNCFATIYDSTGARKGGTPVDQSASWQSTGLKTIALPSSFSASPGMYWVTFLAGNGSTTAPSMLGFGQSFAGQMDLNLANTAYWTAQMGSAGSSLSAQTSVPSSFTPSSNTVIISFDSGNHWCALS